MGNEENIFIRFDNYVLELINSKMKTKFFDIFFPRFTNLAGVSFLVLGIFLIFILPVGPRYKSLALEAATAQIVTGIAVYTIKFLAKRVRPYELIEGLNTFDIIMRDYSFPSGHTAAAFSLSLVVGTYFPQVFLFMVIYAVLIGISRIYLAVHFPTDVLVGGFVGVLMTMLSLAVISPIILDTIGKLFNL